MDGINSLMPFSANQMGMRKIATQEDLSSNLTQMHGEMMYANIENAWHSHNSTLRSDAIKRHQQDLDRAKEITDGFLKADNDRRDSSVKMLNAMSQTTKQLQF